MLSAIAFIFDEKNRGTDGFLYFGFLCGVINPSSNYSKRFVLIILILVYYYRIDEQIYILDLYFWSILRIELNNYIGHIKSRRAEV